MILMIGRSSSTLLLVVSSVLVSTAIGSLNYFVSIFSRSDPKSTARGTPKRQRSGVEEKKSPPVVGGQKGDRACRLLLFWCCSSGANLSPSQTDQYPHFWD
jgi:hypothetical protein